MTRLLSRIRHWIRRRKTRRAMGRTYSTHAQRMQRCREAVKRREARRGRSDGPPSLTA